VNTATSIERILSQGKKSSTYKLAVLRAVIDFVIEHPAREPRNGFHFIPLVELARRALAYYWRPALEEVPQGSAPTQRLPQLVAELSRSGVTVPRLELPDPAAGYALSLWIQEAKALPAALVATLVEIRKTLLEQPIQYIHNVGDDQPGIFSILTTSGLSFSASYEQHRKAALRVGGSMRRARSWLALIDAEQGYIVLSARSYEEISALRFWLRDAIIIRWARECERFAKGQRAVPIHTFELEAPERDSEKVRAVKAVYRHMGLDHCLYTDEALGDSWDLDHFLPWSRFPVNLFWNLVPAAPAANRGKAGKSDQLPALSPLLRRRYAGFLTLCLREGGPTVHQDVAATYQRYFQRVAPTKQEPQKTADEILSVVENSHARLLEAGAELWTPT
jgi:alkylhydroperoxidase family enzyme